ncbi:MAG: glycogen synthase GlgA, partial [Gammaproteobacteria bacterium]|nr:glycogen synthase GlgA [Gammaproteobacteria bacterium]
GGPYGDEMGHDWPDNALRFGLFSRVAARFGGAKNTTGWSPNIIHCNDWQTGLVPAYLAHSRNRRPATVFSIHNLAFQGCFSAELVPYLDLPKSSFSIDGVEFHDKLSFLKAGLFYADHLTTVSPTYAHEIRTAEFGYGMEGLLSIRFAQLTGILNGVDTGHWDPATDPLLPCNYSRNDLGGKSACKAALQKQLGLKNDPDIPVLGLVSRLTWQKGIDLLLGISGELDRQPLQLAILGSGDKTYETQLRQLAMDAPGRVEVHVGYNEALAHLVEAGSDIFLMPSRFEPCGLNQMYSLRYGTLPLVRRTGGLADSVIDATPRTIDDGTATGFVFEGPNYAELQACILRSLLLYRQKTTWRQLQLNGMRQDFSWHHSARQYMELYRTLIEKNGHAPSTKPKK